MFVLLSAFSFRRFHEVQTACKCPANVVNPGWVGLLSSEMQNCVANVGIVQREGLSPRRIINTACLFIYLLSVLAPFYKSLSGLKL